MTEDLEARRGTVTTGDDGRRRLEFRRSWPDPIDDVWAALAEPARMARWIGTYEGERRPGGTGTFAMTHEEEAVGEPMTVVECDPPRRLVVQWVQEQEGSGPWRIDLDLSTEGDRTVSASSRSSPPGSTSPTTRWAGTGTWTSSTPR